VFCRVVTEAVGFIIVFWRRAKSAFLLAAAELGYIAILLTVIALSNLVVPVIKFAIL